MDKVLSYTKIMWYITFKVYRIVKNRNKWSEIIKLY